MASHIKNPSYMKGDQAAALYFERKEDYGEGLDVLSNEGSLMDEGLVSHRASRSQLGFAAHLQQIKDSKSPLRQTEKMPL
mmetsp:Transcript_11031/g.16754  ORF Transcript_11031/g.16754 Transcript_11031/m.16754 type:complete len:80 (-) Transcript_11031:498-737(-)